MGGRERKREKRKERKEQVRPILYVRVLWGGESQEGDWRLLLC